MKLVVISNEKTMHSVCESINKNYPELLKKREVPVNDNEDPVTSNPRVALMVQPTPKTDTKPKSVSEPTSSTLQLCTALVGHILDDVFFITENDGFSVPAERLELVRLDNEIRPGARTEVFGLNLPGQSQHRIVGYVHSALVPLPDHSKSDGYRTPYTVLNDVSILVDKTLFKH